MLFRSIDFHVGTNPNTVTNNSQLFINNGILNHWAIGSTNQFTIFKDNRPINTAIDSGLVTIASGTPTPSITLMQGALFAIANPGPSQQNVTNLLGGYIGQTITLDAESAFNTLVAAAAPPGLVLTNHAGMNFAMPIGTTITLTRITQDAWVEVTRTAP